MPTLRSLVIGLMACTLTLAPASTLRAAEKSQVQGLIQKSQGTVKANDINQAVTKGGSRHDGQRTKKTKSGSK